MSAPLDRGLPWLLGVALLLAAPAAAAQAAESRSSTPFTLLQPDGAGLPATGNLSALRAGSAARVMVPDRWRRLGAPKGRLRLVARQSANCTYDLTYGVTSLLGAADDTAATRVLAALPAAGAAYVLDGGTRGRSAFRVVRRPSEGGRVRIDARWAGLLTRRDDIVPAGRTAWTEIRVAVTSRRGSECHAGSYREALGPAIGDSLAVARTKLRFTPAAGARAGRAAR
jgi:hypothetical protein